MSVSPASGRPSATTRGGTLLAAAAFLISMALLAPDHGAAAGSGIRRAPPASFSATASLRPGRPGGHVLADRHDDTRIDTGREETLLRKALVIKLSEELRTRTGLGLDPIEARMVLGSWRPPAAGSRVTFADGAVRGWHAVSADDRGWFEREDLEGGYAYFAVASERARVVLLQAMGDDMVFVNGAPRAGNQYGLEDASESVSKPWEPRFDYSVIPIPLRAGRNALLFRCFIADA